MEKFLILFPPVKPLTETEAQLFWKENYRDFRTEIKKIIQLDYNFLPIITICRSYPLWTNPIKLPVKFCTR